MGSIDFGPLMESIEARDEWLDDDFPRFPFYSFEKSTIDIDDLVSNFTTFSASNFKIRSHCAVKYIICVCGMHETRRIIKVFVLVNYSGLN